MKFSANLGFLWTDRPLPDAIRAARAAGFAAVECHCPFAIPASQVRAALGETGLPMLGLNTSRGNTAAGDFGLAALPGRETEARAAIDEALAYARATGTRAVHVMAGNAAGPRAHAAFCKNLRYACDAAAAEGINILIEPLNGYDAPGYFLSGSAQAADIIGELAVANLRLMFDCYHLQIMEGDLTRRLSALLPIIGHIQIAAVPDRGAPDHGELDYGHMMRHIRSLGWETPVGAEYRPDADTNASLDWLSRHRNT
jgi:hydroxypyruvate isomerase